MNLKRHIPYCIAVAVLGCAGFLLTDSTKGVDASTPRDTSVAKPRLFPLKGWSVGFHVFKIKDYRELPVKVYGVTSAGEKGLETAHIRSNSDKILTGLKVKWFVGKKGSTAILSKGETPLIELSGLVGALQQFDVKVPDATLERILVPVVRKGQLQGDLDVHVVVSEAHYLDGSSWKLREPRNLVVVPLKRHHAAVDLCAHQTCRLAPDLFSYQCANTDAEECENHGGSCTALICYGQLN